MLICNLELCRERRELVFEGLLQAQVLSQQVLVVVW